MTQYKKIFLIAGVPRSGTSLIAGLLAYHGIWCGKCIPGDADNRYGYFENIEMVDVVKQLFLKNGYKARSDSPVLTKGRMKRHFPFLREQFGMIVKDNSEWLYKDSKLLLINQLMIEAFPEAIWILPRRNDSAVFNSLVKKWNKRPGATPESIHAMIIRLQTLQEQIAGKTKHLWVNSDEIVQSAEYAKYFIEKCGLGFSEKIYNDFVTPKLYHYE